MRDEGYPVFLDVASGRSYALAGRQMLSCGGAERADLVLDDCPREQLLFQLERDDDKWWLQPLSATQSLSVDQTPVTRRTPLRHLSIVAVGRRVFLYAEHDDPNVSSSYSANLWLIDQSVASPSPARQRLRVTATLRLDDPRDTAEAATPLELPGAIALPERQLLIGRDEDHVDICLKDVRVSRTHAWIVRKGNTATITDLKSTNGTFVDGQRIRQPTVVQEGGRVQIGPYNLIFRAQALYPLSHDRNVELAGLRLTRRVPDGSRPGGLKVILDDISLVIRPREFVCILGPSGSGKTTLLSALSGRIPAEEGCVLLNGENLYAHFEALKQNLAVVPQRDVLHDVLPLDIALWFTAKMRLPTDMSKNDIGRRIGEMLDSVSLVPHRSTPIRRLSGGQIKRASWANEAICNPSLIFLDEVTSGLDEQTDCEMMQLFRRMADDGKTIVCVTHSLSYVEQNCHLVVILAPGGALAFVGPPAAALEYFSIPRLGDVYQRLSGQTAAGWREQFRQSKYYQQYVERRLPDAARAAERRGRAQRWQPRQLFDAWRQFALLTQRYLAIQWAQKRALAMMLGQSLFVAVLLAWLFGNLSNLEVTEQARQLADVAAPGIAWNELLEETQREFLTEAEEAERTNRSSRLLFLLAISCFWFGCNNAAKEIVKERTIYSKERDVGLRVPSYYASKLGLLAVLSVLQASLLYAIVRQCTHVGGESWAQWMILSTTSIAGVAMGLAISAIAATEDVAVTMVPIALIPQIVLAGLIAPLLHYTRQCAQLCISAYWSYQGLLLSLDAPLQKRLRVAETLDLNSNWSTSVACLVLVVHILAFSSVAWLVLQLGDARHRHARPRRAGDGPGRRG